MARFGQGIFYKGEEGFFGFRNVQLTLRDELDAPAERGA